MQDFGATPHEEGVDPSALYSAEHAFLQSYTVVPLLYLPKAYGVSARVHNLALGPDGTPRVASLSLEDVR
jgi:hypothetical protein